jgi:hypothetical protein
VLGTGVDPTGDEADLASDVAAAFPWFRISGDAMSEKIPAIRMPAVIFAPSGRPAIRFQSVSIGLCTGRMIFQQDRRQIGQGWSVHDLALFVKA